MSLAAIVRQEVTVLPQYSQGIHARTPSDSKSAVHKSLK